MPIRRFIFSPPKQINEEGVREAADAIMAALHCEVASAGEAMPMVPSRQAQDAAQSADSVEDNDGQGEGETQDEGDSDNTVIA